MYAFARVGSVLQRSDHVTFTNIRNDDCDNDTHHRLDICFNINEVKNSADAFSHPDERALALSICRMTEALHATMEDLRPNILCIYTHNLAVAFNSFYSSCRIMDPELSKGDGLRRIKLCTAVWANLRIAMILLGVPSLDRV